MRHWIWRRKRRLISLWGEHILFRINISEQRQPIQQKWWCEASFLHEEHRWEDKNIGCFLYIVIIQIYTVTVACLGWGWSLLLLLELLPTKCVKYCGNGRTCRRNRLGGHWWELKDIISASLCWKEGFYEQYGDCELGNTWGGGGAEENNRS